MFFFASKIILQKFPKAVVITASNGIRTRKLLKFWRTEDKPGQVPCIF